MTEIYFNSDITAKAVNEIKLLTLYYDKINIVNDCVYTIGVQEKDSIGVIDMPFIPTTFKDDYKLLLDENIISLTERDEQADDPYEKKFSGKLSKIVNANHDLIFPPNQDRRIITEEVYNVLQSLTGFGIDKKIPVETNFLWWYYAFKLKWFIKLLMEGKTCITSSNNLQALFASFIDDISKEGTIAELNKGYTRSLAVDAIRLSLPNPDMLSFEDILELRLALKDELENFKQTIRLIETRNKQILNVDTMPKNYESVLYDEIKKPLEALNLKLKNLHSKTFREFVTKLQNPLSYAPLLGTIVASMPMQYTLLASMGLTSFTSYLQYKEEQREIANNGFYFLLKLKA